MKEFIDYIENACKDVQQTKYLYQFKKKTLDEMNDRASDVRAAGLSDNKVIADLIISEYPDISGEWETFNVKERQRRKEALQHKLLIAGTPLLIILSVAVYVMQGIFGNVWGNGRWLMIVGTVFVMVSLCLLAGVRKVMRMKRIFHPLARIMCAAIVMMIAVFVFLFCGTQFGWNGTWTLLPAGVAALLIGDLIFAFRTHQKFVAINVFVYTPAIFTMLYIVLAALNIISWTRGWGLIFLGFAADALIGLAVLLDNFRAKKEEEELDVWQEN